MPTQPAQQLLYLRIFGRSKPEGGGGGGWSAPSVAARLPSQAWHQTSDVSMSSDIRVSDIGHASDLGYQTSDIAYWISDIRFRTYEIRHRTSAIGQRTSDDVPRSGSSLSQRSHRSRNVKLSEQSRNTYDCVGVNGGRGTRLRLSQHSQGEAKSLKQHALSFREGKIMFFPVDDNRTWNEM